MEVRRHKDAPRNARAGNILLCTKPLKYNGATAHKNGCNSWKGKWFDTGIRETLNGNLLRTRRRNVGGHHIVSMLVAAYLAMVHEYGYSAVLLPSGLLMRQQFFIPNKFHKDLPIMCQVLMGGDPPPFDPNNIEVWTKPFYFEIDLAQGTCRVGLKHSLMMVPITADPRMIRSTNLLLVPSKYTMRPRFDTFFS